MERHQGKSRSWSRLSSLLACSTCHFYHYRATAQVTETHSVDTEIQRIYQVSLAGCRLIFVNPLCFSVYLRVTLCSLSSRVTGSILREGMRSLAPLAGTCYNNVTVGMTGFDREGWPRMASRGALTPLTMEHKLQSAKNTWIPVPQAATAAAIPMVA